VRKTDVVDGWRRLCCAGRASCKVPHTCTFIVHIKQDSKTYSSITNDFRIFSRYLSASARSSHRAVAQRLSRRLPKRRLRSHLAYGHFQRCLTHRCSMESCFASPRLAACSESIKRLRPLSIYIISSNVSSVGRLRCCTTAHLPPRYFHGRFSIATCTTASPGSHIISSIISFACSIYNHNLDFDVIGRLV
jgi:hypothetical protein